jgi:hypothetical protein
MDGSYPSLRQDVQPDTAWNYRASPFGNMVFSGAAFRRTSADGIELPDSSNQTTITSWTNWLTSLYNELA